jgi:Holliday junction resolvase
MVKIYFNDEEYDIAQCSCGSLAVEYDAGMAACQIRCLNCGRRIVHNGFQECLASWNSWEDIIDRKFTQFIELAEVGGGSMARRGNTTFERSIQDSIIEALNKDASTVVRCRSADAVGHVAGDPDIYGSIGGIHVEIEVKRPGEKLTRLQEHRLAEWSDTQAACCWVTSKAQALAFQKAVLAGGCEGCILGPSSFAK